MPLKLLLNFYTLHMVRIWNMYFQKLIVKVIEISSPDHSWPYHGPGSYSPLVSKCVAEVKYWAVKKYPNMAVVCLMIMV